MTVEINRSIGIEIFYGVVEAFHLDIVLAIIIHIVLRDKISSGYNFLNLFSVLILAVMSLGLMMLYIFMGWKVRRLTQSFYKFVVLEVKDMKDEAWRFLLQDKKVRGNVFQRHFNLLNMMKDVVFCLILFFAYPSPLAIVIVLMLLHVPQCVFTIYSAPYLVAWQNTVLKINSVFYVLIDLGFLINIIAGTNMSIETRYYYVGFTLIVLVCLLILCNIGFNTYYGFKETWKKFKKWRERRKNRVADKKAAQQEIQSDSMDGIRKEQNAEEHSSELLTPSSSSNQPSPPPINESLESNPNTNPGKKKAISPFKTSRKPRKDKPFQIDTSPAKKMKRVKADN